ncbi:MAG: SDR family NAD(P)-dependent oxidoreductase, partial [Azoarcus sp.]|nr:SDR family NAD(P)-dependent oxidoreductase [Azoarcus sp.]
GIRIRKPTIPVHSNTTAEIYPETEQTIKQRLAEHLAAPVLFAQEIERMYEDGARVFVEAGPGGVLIGLAGAILEGREKLALIQTERGDREGLSFFLHGLARYIATGREIDMQKLYEGRDAVALNIDAPRTHAKKGVIWNVDGRRAVPEHGELPAHAGRMTSGAALAMRDMKRNYLGGADMEQVMMAYLENMNAMIQDQRDVMLGYLGNPDVAPRSTTQRIRREREEIPVAVTGSGAEAVADVDKTENLPSIQSLTTEQIADIVLQIVSEKTGYPIDMLGLDMNLEADLSIDSIKKIEIVGSLRERIALPESEEGMDAFFEQLISIKTFRNMITWIEEMGKAIAEGSGAAGAKEEAFKGTTIAADVAASLGEETHEIVRMVLEDTPRPLGETNVLALQDKTFAIFDDGKGLAAAVVEELKGRGAQAKLYSGEASELSGCDGLILVNSASGTRQYTILDLFHAIKQADAERLKYVFTFDDVPGALLRAETMSQVNLLEGFPGLLKSLAHEYPEKRFCALTFLSAFDTENFPVLVVDELSARETLPEIFYEGQDRFARLPKIEAAKAAQGDALLELDANANVLVLGGAQGITPFIVSHLAAVSPCRYILVGRSAPEAENAAHEKLETLDAIRKYLIETEGLRTPREVETKALAIFKTNQIRKSIARIEAAGGKAVYRAADVRNPEAFRALIGNIEKEFGKIEGVVHAAGILEDKLFRDKEAASFERVYGTKKNPLNVVLEELLPDLKLLVLFSSMTSSFGNAGQCDYAAGNSVLDLAAQLLGRKKPELRVVAFNWGPWKGAGMVNAGLENEFRKKGIAFLELEKGSVFFVNELLGGDAPAVLAVGGDAGALSKFIATLLGHQ